MLILYQDSNGVKVHSSHYAFLFAIWRKHKEWVLYPFFAFDTTSHRHNVAIWCIVGMDLKAAGIAQSVFEGTITYSQQSIQATEPPPGFETQGRRHQNSKIGVSVAPPNGLMYSKIKKGKVLMLRTKKMSTNLWLFFSKMQTETSRWCRTSTQRRWPIK